MSPEITCRLSRMLRWSSVFWTAVLGTILLLRFPANYLLHSPFLMDFDLFRNLSLRIINGDAIHIYGPYGSAQSLFKYAPCWAVLFTSIGWISAHAGAVLWALMGVAWLIITCIIAEKLCQSIDLQPAGFLPILTVLLLVRPITSEFLLGQTNLLWGMLAASFLWFELTRRFWTAGICLALAISLKLPAILFLVYLALTHRWQSVGRTLLCACIINLAAAWLLLPSKPGFLFISWAHVLRISAPDRAFEIGSQSLLALMGRLLRSDGFGLNLFTLSNTTVGIVTVVIQLFIFLFLFVPRNNTLTPTTKLILDGTLLTILMVLFSPTCWIANYSALIVPVYMLLALLTQNLKRTLSSITLIAATILLVILSSLTNAKIWRLFGVHSFKSESYVYLAFMIFPLFGLCLLWCLWYYRHLLNRCTRIERTT